MEKQNKNLTEDDKLKFRVDKETLEDPNKTKELVNLGKKNPNIEFDLDHPAISKGGSSSSSNSSSMSSMMEQPEAIIEPQDPATIKYLSNIKDNDSGDISKPFNIGDKKYQMVRGLLGKKIVIGVYSFDEMGENGENIIHPMEYFEENIANPMKENMAMVGQDIQVAEEEDTYQGFKHFLVNKQTNEIRKFKTIEEIFSCNKLDEEEYMGVGRFKKHMNEKLFGRRKRINELEPDPAQEMDLEEAKQLAVIVIKALQNNSAISAKLKRVYNSNNVQVKQTLIDYFIKAIGMNPNQIGKYVKTVRDTGKELKNKDTQGSEATEQPITEKRVISKKKLEENLKTKRVIEVIKIKNLFNEQL